MATSNSTNFNMTAQQVVTFALRKIGILNPRETARATDMATGIEDLNLMLKSWQVSGPNLWRMTEGSVALTSTTQYYSLSAAYRVIAARFVQNSIETPMELLTREEYYDLPSKATTGIPTQYYFDPQRGGGTLYIWPVLATAAGETIKYTYQRRFEDIDDKANDLDVPQEYLDLVGYNLAARLCDDYAVDAQRAKQVIGRAAMLERDARDADREPVVRFMPRGF